MQWGDDGLFDRRRQRPSPKRVALKVVRQVLTLYRERYDDLNVSRFHEKLHAGHGMVLSCTWVTTALQTVGLVAKAARRGTHRIARPRDLPQPRLHYGINPTIRNGPPEPLAIFIGNAIIQAPISGSASRLAIFSRAGTFAPFAI